MLYLLVLYTKIVQDHALYKSINPHTDISQVNRSIDSKYKDLITKNRRSRDSDHGVLRTPVRMSTPVRTCRTSPRYRTRNRSKAESDHNSRRRYHPDYDPLIEIRRAQERLDRYRTHGDWKVDMLLCDDADEDLHRYEEKVKRRLSDRVDLMEPIELERRQTELLRRQKDIDIGKVTDRYAEYVLSIPKPERERYHPRTPNKFRKVSRRAWDGMVRKWRKHLHSFEDLNFEESWRSLSTADLSSNNSLSSHSITDSAVSSDSENINPNQYRVRLSAESYSLNTAFQSPKTLTSSPTLKMSHQVKQKQYRFHEDDEDTLESQPKLSRDRKKSGQPTVEEEEDTLSAIPRSYDNRRVTRHSSGNKLSNGPSADVLHSGLTNDMNLLAPTCQKRTNQAVTDVHSLTDFPNLHSLSNRNVTALSSPSKRAKRGILIENGVNGRVN